MGMTEGGIILAMFRRSLIPIAVVIALLASLVVFNVPVQHNRGWIDPVTGSMKTESSLLFVTTSLEIKKSALERWIVVQAGQYVNDWRFLYDISRAVFGNVTAHACGLAPDIYALEARDLNDRFVSSATDEMITEFVRVMRNGTDSDRERAVDAACRIALDAMKNE
jgi:hypothetical protein